VDKLRKPKVEDDLVELRPEPRITHEQFIQVSSFHTGPRKWLSFLGLSTGIRCHRPLYSATNRDLSAGMTRAAQSFSSFTLLHCRKSPLAATVTEPIGAMHAGRPLNLPEPPMHCLRSLNHAEGLSRHVRHEGASFCSGRMCGTVIATEQRTWAWMTIRRSRSRCLASSHR
jgi:hypothetical protein